MKVVLVLIGLFMAFAAASELDILEAQHSIQDSLEAEERAPCEDQAGKERFCRKKCNTEEKCLSNSRCQSQCRATCDLCPMSNTTTDLILLVGGPGDGRYDVEVASPDPDSNPVPRCISALGESESTTTLGNFPVFINNPVGTKFGQIPHVCGGDQNGRHSDQCWKLDGQTLKWSHAGRMNEARLNAVGAHHPQLGFLVSGGSNASYHGDPSGSILSSTEVSTDGRTFSAYTPLPIELSGHCMVALDGDDGEFFLAGGRDGLSELDRAFIHRNNAWVEVAAMPTARKDLMCGPVRASPGGRVQKIIAAGGSSYHRYDMSNFTVEVYDISLNTWETGTRLPHPLQSAAVAEHGNSFNIIGGGCLGLSSICSGVAGDKILKYDPNEGKWIEMKTTLTEGGIGLTAIKVKPTFFKSCQ